MQRNDKAIRYDGFSLRLTTECGTPLLAGGFCQQGYEEHSRRDLLALSSMRFQKDDDIYDIDYRLARAVRECCGRYVWAVGVTAALHDVPYSTGGVIGSPHIDIASAGACVEYIGNGLYMRAFPGGPGCVAACSETGILERIDFDTCPAEEKANALVRRLHDLGVGSFFVVTDGSGFGAKGSFLLEVEGRQSLLRTCIQ